MTKFKPGTEVTRLNGRKRVTGYVVGDYYYARRGKTRELAAIVTGDPTSLDKVFTLVVGKDESVWFGTYDEELRPTGASVEPSVAFARFDDVKRDIANSKAKRRSNAYEESRENGLYDLEDGDAIEVDYSDVGWREAKFAGFVSGSGNVRYLRNGRKRTTHPSNVRIKG